MRIALAIAFVLFATPLSVSAQEHNPQSPAPWARVAKGPLCFEECKQWCRDNEHGMSFDGRLRCLRSCDGRATCRKKS